MGWIRISCVQELVLEGHDQVSLLVGEIWVLPWFFSFVVLEGLNCALAYSVASADVALDVGYFAGVQDFTRGCVELAAVNICYVRMVACLQ